MSGAGCWGIRVGNIVLFSMKSFSLTSLVNKEDRSRKRQKIMVVGRSCIRKEVPEKSSNAHN